MIRLQSSRFSKIQKFVPLIFSHCEPILNIIRVSNSCVYQKTLPAVFEKKRLSLSLLGLSELILKVENGHTVHHPAPPVLRRAGAPGLIKQIVEFKIRAAEIINSAPVAEFGNILA